MIPTDGNGSDGNSNDGNNLDGKSNDDDGNNVKAKILAHAQHQGEGTLY